MTPEEFHKNSIEERKRKTQERRERRLNWNCNRVEEYAREMLLRIDDLFGEGYAKKHPVLLVGLIQAAISIEVHNLERLEREGN